ncbi:hypothetical protein [Nesterenkonia sp. PF2B19]|uniref:hypothetical protein n=1 Tax=unclassified Nesterenkonia TaxID=2629769 RepID=UPI0008725FAA|nr:hypothetical protein [Nesterenkonia sp. PF2B19]OSM44370.1 hypothetical protein BCY76_002290 [Nesterenkonia sp. PF2B19]
MSTQAVPEWELSATPSPDEKPSSLGTAAPTLRALPKVRRRHRGLTAGIIALMVAALAVVLAINIHVSNTQYRVVELTQQHQLLTQQNQALEQQVLHLQSPQVLSDNAVSLGMVMPAAAGAFELDGGTVTGPAEAADSSDRPSSFVSTPVQPGDEAAPSLDVAEEAGGAPAGLLGSGALNTLTQPTPGHNGQQADSESAADDGRGFSPDRLNGGTIPAPGLD